MNDTVTRYLDDLEARIDPDVEDRLWQEWDDFSRSNRVEGLFSPTRASKAPPAVEI